MSEPARTVFFGSGGFAVPIFRALLESPEVEVVAAVTAPDRPLGRSQAVTPTPVARLARERDVALLQPVGLRNAEAIASIAVLGARLGVLADYGRIVPQAILDLAPAGILNVHPSLLPRWRGAAPIPAAILAGDVETGVTLIRMDAGLDTGPIVAVERWPLGVEEDAPGLEERAARIGAGLVARTVGPWLRDEVAPRPQGEVGVTLTRPLRRDDGRLDPTLPAEVLERQVRAFRPWPSTFIETIAGRIAVLRADVAGGPPERGHVAGRLGPGGLAAGEGTTLTLLHVQPAGGRPMAWADLVRGRPALIGSTVVGPSA